jgi:hypothetical protein
VLLLGLFLLGCTSSNNDDDAATPIDDDTQNSDDDASVDDDTAADDDSWQPVEPHRESYQGFTIVWLKGTPYEMGQQQGQLLHDELKAGYDWLSQHYLNILLMVAKALKLPEMAHDNSYPDIVDECQGLVDAAGDTGWTMDLCLLINFGDVLIERLDYGPAPGKATPACTQIVGAYDATTDGRLYHARSLDWSKIDYLIDYPVIFVRQPDDAIPHAYIGFPGNLSPYSGINAAGLSVASDEADPHDDSERAATGRSHVQMQAMLLKQAHNLDEAKAFIEAQKHMSTEIIVVADGPNREAAVFEMTAKDIGIRELQNGVVFATNHFLAPVTVDEDADPASSSSLLRYARVEQLIPPDGQDTIYGDIDPTALVGVLRDRINPYDGTESPIDTFDNDSSIATNGAVYQIVFDPANLCFWVAAGAIPVPVQPFVGFSLGELLNLPNAVSCEPAVFPHE